MKNNKYVILCVDDDKDFLDSIEIILESENFIMESASTAQAGLAKFKAVKPDCIIVDLMMEEIDSGTNLVKDLKAAGAKIPIYMLSSVGDNMNQNIDFSELGLTGILQKPVNPKTLLATLKAKLK